MALSKTKTSYKSLTLAQKIAVIMEVLKSFKKKSQITMWTKMWMCVPR